MEAEFYKVFIIGKYWIAKYVPGVAGHAGWLIGKSCDGGYYRKIFDRLKERER